LFQAVSRVNTGFDPSPVYAGFVVDKLVLGHASVKAVSLHQWSFHIYSHIISAILSYHLIASLNDTNDRNKIHLLGAINEVAQLNAATSSFNYRNFMQL
jgi:hypothetical protein